jgi:transposase-like protein
MNNLRCPQCELSHIKRNGYTHYGKQNYRCKICDRQAEADETWSFVASKENKQWVWIAIDVDTKQVIAFYVGDRSASSSRFAHFRARFSKCP